MASVIIAPAYTGNQVEGAGYGAFFLWGPTMVMVGILGAVGLSLARTGLGSLFLGLCLFWGILSLVFYPFMGGIGMMSPLVGVAVIALFLVALNAGAIYGTRLVIKTYLRQH